MLNDKSDDDDSGNKQHSELLKRLQNPTKDEKEMNNNADLDNEALKQRLRFQGGPGSLENNNRKRASDESDDSSGAPKARLSKLQQRNQMLASLLAVPCRPITNTSTTVNLPTVRQMPDIPTQHKHNQMASPIGSGGSSESKPPTTPNQNIPNNKNMNNNNPMAKNSNLKGQQQKLRQLQQQQQQNLSRQQSLPSSNQLKQMGENVYLSQLQSHQQQQQIIAMSRANVVNSQSSFDGSNDQYVTSSPAITLAVASSSTINIQQSDSVIDPELNDILDNLFDEGSYSEDQGMQFMQNVNTVSNNAQLKHQEEMAQINKIQQSLMECEDEANFSGSPPAYPMHSINAQNARALPFSQPPPSYNQRNIRLPQMSNNNNNGNNLVTNSNASAGAQATNSQKPMANAMLIERIRLQQQHQIMEKQRLLQQQQNQQIVVTAGADQMCKKSINFCDIQFLTIKTFCRSLKFGWRSKYGFSFEYCCAQRNPSKSRENGA